MNVTKFRKGFSDAVNHEAFVSAVAEGDCDEIAAVLNNVESERPHVDVLHNAVPRAVQRAIRPMTKTLPSWDWGSAQHLQELSMLRSLAENRDRKLKDMADAVADDTGVELAEGFYKVSRALDCTEYLSLAKDRNYGTTKASHRKIQAGDAFNQSFGQRKTGISTGRDASAFVFTDNPITPWFKLIDMAMAEGCKVRLPQSMQTRYNVGGAFTVYGAPCAYSLCGEALKLCVASFVSKWHNLQPRPEEDAPVLGNFYLPLAYAEGSPMHPADPEMHEVIADACARIVSFIFAGEMFEDGTLVSDEGRLQAENIGLWRIVSAVHYLRDHENAKVIGKEVAYEVLKATYDQSEVDVRSL